MWTAAYPSGFQPYRKSHTNLDLWVMAGYDKKYIGVLHEVAVDVLQPSELGDRAAHPRHLPVLQHRRGRAAEDFAGKQTAQQGADNIAAAWDKLTDKLGRENQVKYYRIAMGLSLSEAQ